MKKLFKYLLVTSILFYAGTAKGQTIKKWKLADLKSYLATTQKPTIINFWATFCKPCVHEIPYFQTIAKKYKSQGVDFILVSLDLKEAYPSKIVSFARKRKFTVPLYYLDETNADLFCPVVDKSWSGAIPASLFFNNKTGYRKFFEEEIAPATFEVAVQEMIR